MTSANPWIVNPEHETAPEVAVRTDRPLAARPTGASAPQPGVPVPDVADRLPWRSVEGPAIVWWLGVHGGAGESTLAALALRSLAAEHAWPIPPSESSVNRIVIVARSNYAGLMAARRAATEWASNALGPGVQLLGLVLIADAPGRRPKSLRELEKLVAGGVPKVWNLPWVEAWRTSPASASSALPKEFRTLFADLSLSTAAAAVHD